MIKGRAKVDLLVSKYYLISTMEDMKNQNRPEGCKCWMHDGSCCGMCAGCHGWHGGAWMLVRIVLAIVIVIVVFALGVKLGEFKADISNMIGWHGGYSGGYQMMMGRGGYYPPTAVSPALPAAPSTAK
jgi:hypothetical protein